jgi:dihydropyrimidine dehydrogenase (NAD+) subunit PreA
MVQQIADIGIPVSGIGGISNWRDAAEFLLLGCQSLQLCTAPMHYGFRIVEDMIDGLRNWMDEKGFRTIDDFRGLSLPNVKDWKNLNLNYKIVAKISKEKCIGCDLCYIACWDGAHQCIHLDARPQKITVTPIPKLDGPISAPPVRVPRVDEAECVGCNLCALVCPVENCITMERVDHGIPAQSWEQRNA